MAGFRPYQERVLCLTLFWCQGQWLWTSLLSLLPIPDALLFPSYLLWRCAQDYPSPLCLLLLGGPLHLHFSAFQYWPTPNMSWGLHLSSKRSLNTSYSVTVGFSWVWIQLCTQHTCVPSSQGPGENRSRRRELWTPGSPCSAPHPCVFCLVSCPFCDV